VELEFRLGEFFARQILTKNLVMNRVDLRLPEIVRATELAAVNGSQDHGRRSDLNIQLWPKILSTYIFFYLSGILLSILFPIDYRHHT